MIHAGRTIPAVRILVIDDYEDVRTTLESAVAALGYDTRACRSDQALPLSRTFLPEIVLIELAPHTRRLLPQLRAVLGPIVAIGMMRDHDEANGIELAESLLKPFTVDELRVAIARSWPPRYGQVARSQALTSVDADQLVSDAIAGFQLIASSKGIRVRRDGMIAGARLLCERDRIVRVFASLLDDAIKASQLGDEVVVRGAAGESDARFAISDPGAGFSADELTYVFGPASGRTLGSAKRIIDAHAGTIWVESSVGDGTIVFFTLPLAR